MKVKHPGCERVWAYLHGMQHDSTYISGRLMAEDKADSVTPICADRVEIRDSSAHFFNKLVARKVGRVSCSCNKDVLVKDEQTALRLRVGA